jgi:hypothetical protein
METLLTRPFKTRLYRSVAAAVLCMAGLAGRATAGEATEVVVGFPTNINIGQANVIAEVDPNLFYTDALVDKIKDFAVAAVQARAKILP